MWSVLLLASVIYGAQGDITQLSNEIFDAKDLQTNGDARILTLSNDHEISLGFHTKGTDDKTAHGPVVYKEKLVKNYSNAAQMQSGKQSNIGQKQSQFDHQMKQDEFAVPVGDNSPISRPQPFSPMFDLDAHGAHAQNMNPMPPRLAHGPNQCPAKMPPVNHEAQRGMNPALALLYLLSMQRGMSGLPDQHSPMMHTERSNPNHMMSHPMFQMASNPPKQNTLPLMFNKNRPMGQDDAWLTHSKPAGYPSNVNVKSDNSHYTPPISEELKLSEAINRHNKNSQILAAAMKKQTENERILKESMQRNDISILELPIQQHLKNRNVLQDALKKHAENKKILQRALAHSNGNTQSNVAYAPAANPNIQPHPVELTGLPVENTAAMRPMQKRSLVRH